MDFVVVDASTVIKWYITEPFSVEALRVFDSYSSGKVALLAPDLLLAEIGNILWKKQQHQGLLVGDAVNILHSIKRLRVATVSTATLLDDAFRLALTYKRSVYNSLYLALSLRQGCEMVTADERLVNAVGSFFPNLVWVTDWQETT